MLYCRLGSGGDASGYGKGCYGEFSHIISPRLLFAAVNKPFELPAAGYVVEFFAAEHAEVYCKDAVYAYAQSHG